MEIIGAAALIAVGIVVAAVVYGRTHAPRPAVASGREPSPDPAPAVVPQVAVRESELARREAELARHEAELERERQDVSERRSELERELERISGLSAARAKQLLLKQVEDQARHDAARKVRQIEEETKRDADRRVRNILSVCMQRLAAGHAA